VGSVELDGVEHVADQIIGICKDGNEVPERATRDRFTQTTPRPVEKEAGTNRSAVRSGRPK
jgi:hypothetical protein